MSMEGTPGIIVEPSGGVEALIQRNTDKGRLPLDNTCKMLASLLLLLLLLLLLSIAKYRYDVVVHPVVFYYLGWVVGWSV